MRNLRQVLTHRYIPCLSAGYGITWTSVNLHLVNCVFFAMEAAVYLCVILQYITFFQGRFHHRYLVRRATIPRGRGVVNVWKLRVRVSVFRFCTAHISKKKELVSVCRQPQRIQGARNFPPPYTLENKFTPLDFVQQLLCPPSSVPPKVAWDAC